MPEITANGLGTENIKLTSSIKNNIQWYKDGQILTDQTSSDLAVTEPGLYSVRCTVDGCSTDSNNFSLIITGVEKETTINIGRHHKP
jgi:hypothetical protein